MREFIVVFITAPKETDAEKIAKAVVDARLAACVNIITNMRSIYRWQGNVVDDQEVLLVLKTRKELFARLAECVKGLHSYSVPEIIALPVIEGSEDYLNWLHEETEPGP